MCKDFCHLHVHTEMSLLDGLGTPDALISHAKKLGQRGLAITDHGNMSGVIDFFRTAKKYEMIPIIGCEVYQTPYGISRFDKNVNSRKIMHSLILAENDQGYKNLIKLSTLGFLEGFYTKPRIDHDLLEKYKSGLIVTTGCMAAEIPQMIMHGQEDTAIDFLVDWHINIFGRDNYYVELQHHDGIPEIVDLNKRLIGLSKKHNLKLLVTNDVHYPSQQDAGSHDVLLCVQTRARVDQSNRMKFSGDDYYIKTREQLEKEFAPYGIDGSAFDNTIEIMERCSGVNLESTEKHHMPNIEITTGAADYNQELRNLIKQRLPQFFPIWKDKKKEIAERIEYELKVIEQTGFAVYYLIIFDICKIAKENNIIWNVRGSGAGSIISYILGMSFVDPMEYGLLFERFLNPVRVSTPDFDMDFPDNLREPIVNHLIGKYGEEQVAQIITFGRMKARMCIRDVARVYGWEQSKADYVANMILNTPGKPITIENSLDESSEYYSALLKKAYDSDAEIKKILDIGISLEKTARHTGIHAAAVAIADKPLVEYVPLTRGNSTTITKHVTQFDYPTLESLGILKVDILGLATLSIINKALELIKKRHGIDLSYEKIPFDPNRDSETESAYNLLCSSEVSGVFQVESHGLKNILSRLQPRTFQQIMDVISLYRPGPIDYIDSYIARANSSEAVEFAHESLRPILEKTQGIMIYQEQIMQVLQTVGGYSLAEADVVRKAISKKDQEKIHKEREAFVHGALTNGYMETDARKIFDDIEKFALYGFNMAHAASYARMTVITAWLKATFPLEYMAASLIVEGQKTEKVILYIQECKRMGIPVLQPSIHSPSVDFTIDDNSGIQIDGYSGYKYEIQPGQAIRFGFGSIKQVGEETAKYLYALGQNKEFLETDDIFALDAKKFNTRSLRRIFAAGVFDNIVPRESLVGNEESILEFCKNTSDVYYTGQRVLVKPSIDLTTQPNIDMIAEEKESLGIWLTSHPVEAYYRKYPKTYTHTLYDVINGEEESEAVIMLAINSVKTITGRNGKPMCFLQCSDPYGTIEAVVFSDAYESIGNTKLVEDAIIIAQARISYKKTEPSLIIKSVLNEDTEHIMENDEHDAVANRLKIMVHNKIEFMNWASKNLQPSNSTLIFKVYDAKKNAIGKLEYPNSCIRLSLLKKSGYIYSVEE